MIKNVPLGIHVTSANNQWFINQRNPWPRPGPQK